MVDLSEVQRTWLKSFLGLTDGHSAGGASGASLMAGPEVLMAGPSQGGSSLLDDKQFAGRAGAGGAADARAGGSSGNPLVSPPGTKLAKLEVRVIGLEKRPQGGATVKVSSGPSGPQQAIANDQGVARFELQPGDYQIDAIANIATWDTVFVKAASLQPGKTHSITLDKVNHGILTVSVMRETSPEPDAEVSAPGASQAAKRTNLMGQTDLILVGGTHTVVAASRDGSWSGATNAKVTAGGYEKAMIQLSRTAKPNRPSGEPGFGDKPRVLDPTEGTRSKEPLPERPGLIATPHGYLVQSVQDTSESGKSFNEFTAKTVKHDKEARAIREKLDRLEAQEMEVRGFTQTHLKTLEAEVGANQSDAIKAVARDMEQQRQHFALVETVLKGLKIDIEQAKGLMESARLRLDSVQNLESARRLSQKAEKYAKELETALSLIGNVIEYGAAIVSANPAGKAKPIWDAITTIVKLKKENPFAKEAEDRRKTGTNQALQAANLDIDNALDVIDKAGALAEDTQKQHKESVDSYFDMREDAERLYDGSTGGNFKFGDLVKHLAWIESSASLGNQTIRAFGDAYFYADALRDLYRSVMAKMDSKSDQAARFIEGALVAKELANAHAKGKNAASSKRNGFVQLHNTLSAMRDTANQKLARAPVPKHRQK